MKVREYQLDKLARARELQKEAAALHIPMPVLSWEFEVKDKCGVVIEKGAGKANSYTRNALNNIAWDVGFASITALSSTGFGDGIISNKSYAGTITQLINRTTTSESEVIFLGTGTTETLDDYEMPAYECSTSAITQFNAEQRKLITVRNGIYVNSTGSDLNITEAAIVHLRDTTSRSLYVHDVFSPALVPNGGIMRWAYLIEIAYPNP